MKKDKRSPIKDEPLRDPGQSAYEQRLDLVFDKILLPAVIVLVFVSMAGMEWLRAYKATPPQPVFFTVMAVLALTYAAFQWWRVRLPFRNLGLALRGERTVGQFLEGLREQGFHVFHDVLGDGFNVDHVLVGKAGVFTVETKTISKPANDDAKVQFDGEMVVVNGFKPDRDPVTQARAQARWIRDLIAESTGRKFKVRPVVVYPGWWVECSESKRGDVWVLNPKALPAFIDHEPACLEQEDIHLISFHLGRFVMAQQRAARRWQNWAKASP